MARVFSMIQPSGELGIGHYLGAIKHWERLQSEGHEGIYAIADLHAITVPQEPKVLKQRTLDLVAFYLACGIDPDKSIIFTQSHVTQHAELAWILSCITSMGELNRMTQFKDKTQSLKRERIGVGLHAYPILMAADILAYQTEIVPVGADQKQHLELARDLAERFNTKFSPVFTMPEPMIAEHGSRIKSLTDPSKKMSKSDKDSNSYIALTDSPKVIEKKIMRAVTDSLDNFAYDPEQQPGLASLIEMYAVLNDTTPDAIVGEFSRYGDFKKALAASLNTRIGHIMHDFSVIRGDEERLGTVLASGAERASVMAQKTLEQVYDAVGLL